MCFNVVGNFARITVFDAKLSPSRDRVKTDFVCNMYIENMPLLSSSSSLYRQSIY